MNDTNPGIQPEKNPTGYISAGNQVLRLYLIDKASVKTPPTHTPPKKKV